MKTGRPSASRKVILRAMYITLAFLLLLPSFLRGGAEPAIADGYIKWVDFDLTSDLIRAAVKCDLETYEAAKKGSGTHAELVTILAIAAADTGGEVKRIKTDTIRKISEHLAAGEVPEDITKNPKLFVYYSGAYGAALGGVMGNYAVKGSDGNYEKRYGVRVFSPIAAGYHYGDYDDFGASRSYGYRRPHLGHDMLGDIGTPIVAVESGRVEACGWNQYGGWRIGIRSHDGKRYYYYAHLRRGHPFAGIEEGMNVTAGEVIGYLGMTGYSAKEDTNNIDTPHLHFGLELIFDESQKDGWNQIWIDLYEYTKFLSRFRSATHYDKESGETVADSVIIDLDAPD